jgi:hypothetical protein
MSVRPKPVSFVAVSFVIIALILIFGASQRLLHFFYWSGVRHLLFGLFFLVLAGFLFSCALGLWRLSANSWLRSVILSAVVGPLWIYTMISVADSTIALLKNT